MNYSQQPGTYCFHNTVNNKVYIGSAQCLYNRLNNHFKNQNSRPVLQDAIKKYGLKAFSITCVNTKTYTEALMQEQLMLDYLFQNNIPKYNIAPIAGGGKTLSDYSNHNAQSKKVRYALEVNNPKNIYTFESSYKASNFTKVSSGMICRSCKTTQLYNSELGRWLFSNVSIDDLKAKFNNLTQAQIKGQNKYTKGFILINKNTQEQSQIFYGVYEPQKQGYKISHSNLNSCLLGNLKTVGGYYVIMCL